jgi:hypothetical protein
MKSSSTSLRVFNKMSLGWITESAVQPKKAKVIDNVDQHTLLGLQSVLFQAEAEFKHAGGSVVRTKPSARIGSGLGRNAGVTDRARRDLVIDAAELDSVSHALKRKAEIYNAIASGKATASGNFLIDFERKTNTEEVSHVEGSLAAQVMHFDMRKEREAWERQALATIERLEGSNGNNTKEYFGGIKNVSALSQDEKELLEKMSAETLTTRQMLEEEKNTKQQRARDNRLQQVLIAYRFYKFQFRLSIYCAASG